jgi:hypothetical protein
LAGDSAKENPLPALRSQGSVAEFGSEAAGSLRPLGKPGRANPTFGNDDESGFRGAGEEVVMERRTFLATAAAAATAMALDPAKADKLPLGNLPNWRYPDPRVEALDKKFKYKVGNAAIERIATGFRWAEGPVYFRDGGYLVWSDIPNNRMMRWLEEDGHVSVFRTPSNYTNGNTRDREGRLISCEHDARRVTRTEPDGSITVLIDSYEGKKLNAPNDVVVAADGAIWFTDPGYGILPTRRSSTSSTPGSPMAVDRTCGCSTSPATSSPMTRCSPRISRPGSPTAFAPTSTETSGAAWAGPIPRRTACAATRRAAS